MLVFLAFSLLSAGLWIAAKIEGRKLAAYVETTAEWTRFDAPVQPRSKGADLWMVPVHFTYRVGENRFSGNDMIYQSIFDERPPEIGASFRVWYDPDRPSRVVRLRGGPALDAWLFSWLTGVSAVLAVVCGTLALLRGRPPGGSDPGAAIGAGPVRSAAGPSARGRSTTGSGQ